jgi:hypothetical protein
MKGTGPNGPHASIFQHLLERFLYQEPVGGGGGGYVVSNYNLCNKCHNVSGVIYQDVGGFHHSNHMQKGVACTTCHDPHGVINGTATNNFAMINLDTAVPRPYNGALGYFHNGTTLGTRGCYLVCHGENHTPHTY